MAPELALPEPRAGDPEITPELVDEHGLSPEEYDKIVNSNASWKKLEALVLYLSEQLGGGESGNFIVNRLAAPRFTNFHLSIWV